MSKNRITYAQRITAFRSGKCPYCDANGTILKKNKGGLRGYCGTCKAECNFTNEKYFTEEEKSG
jgi:hypothetical protein